MATVSLTTAPKWEDLPLVKLLGAPYQAAIDRVYGLLEPIMGSRPMGAEEYTDHDLKHSARIVQRVGQILPQDGAELNQPELYVFLLAALLHDAGMWTPREEAVAMLEDADFRAHFQNHRAHELEDVERALALERRAWMGQLGLQTLAATYNRTKHPERLGTFVLKDDSPTGTALRILMGAEFVDAVVAVSVAHSWDHDVIVKNDALNARMLEGQGEVVNLRFLALLLRLGDLLDLGEGRVSTLLWDYLRPLNEVSEAHWRKESRIRLDLCNPDFIRITGQFDIDKNGVVEREAYRLWREWLSWLDKEIRFAHHLPSAVKSEFTRPAYLGALELDNKVKATGLAEEGDVSFELDRKRIMKLLGEEIYEGGCVFVRELLQNAVDATRAQMVRDHRERVEKQDPAFPADRPWHWPREVTGNYVIEVTTGEETVNDTTYKTYSISDPGTGMTLEQIRKYFLQVGVSYYKTDEYKKEFSFPSISEFGIGFLSCLLVADRIEVVTRPHNEPKGLRLTIQSPSQYFLVERIEGVSDAPAGTRVLLWIDPSRERVQGWDKMPLEDDRIHEVMAMPKGEDGDFATATGLWGMLLEFPLAINSAIVGPHDFKSLNALFVYPHDRADRESTALPITIASNSDRILGDGEVAFLRERNTKVPQLCSRMLYGSSKFNIAWYTVVRGLYNIHNASGSNIAASFFLNFSGIPRRSLTAGRRLRSVEFMADVRSTVVSRLVGATYDQLRGTSIEAAALWRAQVPQLKGCAMPPVLYPCRTQCGFDWLSIGEVADRHERVLLVPFDIAWHGDWSLDTPCVGIYGFGGNEFSQTFESPLVIVEDTCTGYVWPPEADCKGLPLFAGRATYLRDTCYTWISDQVPRCESGGNDVEWVIELDGDLPDYDRFHNPWEKWGWNSAGYRSPCADKVREVLSSVPPIVLPDDLLTIVIEDGDDWE